MAWYDDLTYAQSEDGSSPKALPTSCCNGPSCNSVEPDYIQREPFIDTTTAKVTEVDREWVACRTLALKQWRTETSDRLWRELGVTEAMPESLIMPDCCLASLATSGRTLKLEDLAEFLEPWHGVDKHANEIFHCLEMNCPSVDSDTVLQLPSKANRKTAL